MIDMKGWQLLAGVVLILVLAMFVWRSHSPAPGSLWHSPAHVFDPERCGKGGCQELLRLPMAEGQLATLMVDSLVDDETAQWADCLASVAVCIDEGGGNEVDLLLRCVERSRCPARCRGRFVEGISEIKEADALWNWFDRLFVVEGAPCAPSG